MDRSQGQGYKKACKADQSNLDGSLFPAEKTGASALKIKVHMTQPMMWPTEIIGATKHDIVLHDLPYTPDSDKYPGEIHLLCEWVHMHSLQMKPLLLSHLGLLSTS